MRALIFDSKYDLFKGVVAYVRIMDGRVSRDNKVLMIVTGKDSTVVEVGYFKPNFEPTKELGAGEIGYIATGFKDVSFCRVGDTVTLSDQKEKIQALPGYREVKPMVYASFYPTEGDDYTNMRDALDKLKLNDAAFVFEPEKNPALGKGFRCGFLGLLHLEICQARLEREFNISPVVTTPSVVYKIGLRDGKEVIIYSPIDLPDLGEH